MKKKTLHDAQNCLYDTAIAARLKPPSAGHSIFKWVYREGNERADALTWRARNGDTGVISNHDIINQIREKKVMINALRGAFDGGRSELGVGCGWFIDVHIYSISPSSQYSQDSPRYMPFWLNDVMSESFLLPPICTVTQAELTAACRLLLGLKEFTCLACLC